MKARRVVRDGLTAAPTALGLLVGFGVPSGLLAAGAVIAAQAGGLAVAVAAVVAILGAAYGVRSASRASTAAPGSRPRERAVRVTVALLVVLVVVAVVADAAANRWAPDWLVGCAGTAFGGYLVAVASATVARARGRGLPWRTHAGADRPRSA